MRDDETIVIASAVNVVIGIWLVLSPLVLSYHRGDPLVQALGGGALIATLAWIRAARTARTAALSWANAALGIWLLITALIVDMTPTVATNLAVCGGLVAIFAVVSAFSA